MNIPKTSRYMWNTPILIYLTQEVVGSLVEQFASGMQGSIAGVGDSACALTSTQNVISFLSIKF